jgi:hypothetical protein
MASDKPLQLSKVASTDSAVHDVIEEFGRLLAIFSEQLVESLREADKECMAVGESFHELAAAKRRIERASCPEPEQTMLRNACVQIDSSLGAAVIALQYHDRLAQRVGHIHVGLTNLQNLLGNAATRSNDEWLQLLKNVEHSYHREWHRLVTKRAQGVDVCAAEINDASNVELF